MMSNRTKKREKPTITTSGRISREELEHKGGTLPTGHGHWIRKELKVMDVGGLLFVSRQDWNWKPPNSPARIANDESKNSNKQFTTSVTKDHSGWVIERVK